MANKIISSSSPMETRRDFYTADRSVRLVQALQVDLDTLRKQIEEGMDVLPKVEELATDWPHEIVVKALSTDESQAIDALRDAKSMYAGAKHLLNTTETKTPIDLRARLNRLLDSMINFIEALMNAFGIADLCSTADNQADSRKKGERVLVLLSLFSALTALLIPAVGAPVAGMVIGGGILVFAALSIIYPRIRPALVELPYGTNWSLAYRRGDRPFISGRMELLDRAAEQVSLKQPILLVGKSGIGKTAMVRGLVRAIEEGTYPNLNGKQVIYFNAANLVADDEKKAKILSDISKGMGRHKDRYILVFDGIHAFCRKGNRSVSEQLCTMLGPDDFPHVIGISTEEDYSQEIHPLLAFTKRFQKIALQNTTDVETLTILGNEFLRKAPNAILEQNGLVFVLNQAKKAFGEDAPMPSTAQRILSQCIHKVSDAQKSTLEKEVDCLMKEVALSRTFQAAGQVAESSDKLEQQLKEMEQLLNQEKREIDRLVKMRAQFGKSRRRLQQAAVAVAEQGRAASSRQKNAFLLMKSFFVPALENKVRSLAERHGIRVAIDAPLIEKAIEEEIANGQQIDASLRSGQATVARLRGG